MRLVHTADWQVGMAAAHLGDLGAPVRAQRLETGKRLVAQANGAGADLLLVAGDLFEHNAVKGELIQKTADILARFHGPVYIIPGNHDPYLPGSAWEHPAWSAAGNLTVISDAVPVAIDQGTLFPCPLRSKNDGADPTAWITPETGSGIRIGLAHGNVTGKPGVDAEFPIARDAASRAGLDYLALGHWHSMATFPDSDDSVRMAYCGTPEPTRFGERNAGHALLVEIVAPGAIPRIDVWDTAHYHWEQIRAEMGRTEDMPALEHRLARLDTPETTLLEVRLQGLLPARDLMRLNRLREQAEARLAYLRWHTAALRPAPEDGAWIEDLPPGILQNAARRLQQQAAAAPTDADEARAAGLALQELYLLVGEAAS